MTDRFTATDFTIDMAVSTNAKQSADIANAWLEARLGPVVYKPDREIEGLYWTTEPSKYDKHTHTARLFNVRLIERKECEHQAVLPEFAGPFSDRTHTCIKCGARLKAKWEAV